MYTIHHTWEEYADIPKPLTLRDNQQTTYRHSAPSGHKITLGSLEHWLATIGTVPCAR